MKKGDVVTVRDSSYSKVITEHGLKSSYDGVYSIRDKQGVIVELNCKISDPNKYQVRDGRCNNTVVRIIDSGKVVFIEERFLRLVEPTHKVMIGITKSGPVTILGQIIEISDKLYKEIKREPQTK